MPGTCGPSPNESWQPRDLPIRDYGLSRPKPLVPAAVCFSLTVAVRTEQPQIINSIVESVPVYVIEMKRKLSSLPHPNATANTSRSEKPARQQPSTQQAGTATIRASTDKNQIERNFRHVVVTPPSQMGSANPVSCIQIIFLDAVPQGHIVSARRAQTQERKRLRG